MYLHGYCQYQCIEIYIILSATQNELFEVRFFLLSWYKVGYISIQFFPQSIDDEFVLNNSILCIYDDM